MSKQIVPMIDMVANDLDEHIQNIKASRNFTADYMLLALNKAIEHLHQQKDNDYALLILNMEDRISQLMNKNSESTSQENSMTGKE